MFSVAVAVTAASVTDAGVSTEADTAAVVAAVLRVFGTLLMISALSHDANAHIAAVNVIISAAFFIIVSPFLLVVMCEFDRSYIINVSLKTNVTFSEEFFQSIQKDTRVKAAKLFFSAPLLSLIWNNGPQDIYDFNIIYASYEYENK